MADTPFELNEVQQVVYDAIVEGDYVFPGAADPHESCQKVGIPTTENRLGKAIKAREEERNQLRAQAMSELESGSIDRAEEFIAQMNAISLKSDQFLTSRQQERLQQAYAAITGEQPETSEPSVHVDLGGKAEPVVMGKVFTDQPRVWYKGPVTEFHGWARLYDGGTLVLEDGYVVLNNVDISHYVEEAKVKEETTAQVDLSTEPAEALAKAAVKAKKAPAKKASAKKAAAKKGEPTWGRYLNARRANGTHVNSRVKIPEDVDIEDLNACAKYFKKHCKEKGWTFLSVGAKCAAK